MVKTVLLTLLLPALVLAAVPSITRPVTDPQGMLTSQEMESVSRALVDLRAAKQVQMAVLLVDTTDGQPIEDYAQAVFRDWKGGEAGRDNGLLLVIARGDRRSRLEVGYGLESSLPDGEATALLHAQGPLLREGRFEPALLAIIAGVDAQVSAGAFPAGPSATTPPWTPSQTAWFLVALFVTACVMARLLLQVQASYPRDPRGLTMAALLVALPLAALVSIGWSGPRSPVFILVAYGALMGLFFWGWRLFQRQERAMWGLLLLLTPMMVLAYSQLVSHDPILGLGDLILWVVFGSLFSFPVLLPLMLLGFVIFRSAWNKQPRGSWAASGSGGSASSDWSVSSSSSYGSSSSYDSSSSYSSDSSSSYSSDSSSSSSDWGGGGGDSGGGGGSDSW
ncbi:TPM domain-containing protein [Corallococcus carmarthensis]|uniref:TPM domain-containing protein n=1 Tax=Corallococcus carmarthensis TaxID=2316728 RepID=A0A3A8JWJ2_9BACT|nr:TPM domain-containing protein [Corallococcus carmarthensis]RKH00303.1 TPM domain-containing protein [Corallococcus carmarthensis]